MIALPSLIPNEHWIALSLAINKGDTDQVKYLVEEYDLDVNSFMDNGPACMPVLMEALLSNGFSTTSDHLQLLRYLLEKGASPNIGCRKGYNCLHIAVQQDKYIRALNLFLDYDADVNIPDADGANVVYWAIQRFLLRKEDVDEDRRMAYLRVLAKILHLGADLDQPTRYDMTPRGWLEHAAPEVRTLVARWEEEKPVIHHASAVQPRFPTQLRFPQTANKIWKTVTPSAGHRDERSPGALLRIVETLRDDARQPNARIKKEHKRMATLVRDTLVRSGAFDKQSIEEIRRMTDKLVKTNRPYIEDDVYDQLVDQICMLYDRKQEAMA